MLKVVSQHIPTSHALSMYLMEKYPQTSYRIYHNQFPEMRGVWVSSDNDAFFAQSAMATITECEVVRAITADGETLWTLEKWTHGNGYQATFEFLTKEQFLSRINS